MNNMRIMITNQVKPLKQKSNIIEYNEQKTKQANIINRNSHRYFKKVTHHTLDLPKKNKKKQKAQKKKEKEKRKPSEHILPQLG